MGTKRRSITWFAAALCVALAAGPAGAQAQAPPRPAAPSAPAAEEFGFYGLRFGMTVEQVQERFPTNPAGTELVQPGHGMASLALTYDFRGRLSEIRAAWERPADRLQDTALRQALREKFVQPIGARWRTVTVDVDEIWNRAALTLVMISGDLRQEAIEYYKAEYLKRME